MDDIVRVENLVFEYQQDDGKDSIKAIDGVSLNVRRGSFIAVIGRNAVVVSQVGGMQAFFSRQKRFVTLFTMTDTYIIDWIVGIE